MTVRDVWHTGFTVSDLERSILFYRDGLGLTLRHRQTQANAYTSRLVGFADACLRVAQFALPGHDSRSGHVLELAEYVNPPGETSQPRNNRIAAGHLAFEVDSIDELVPRLTNAGATFLSHPQSITDGINRSGRTVYLRDPDGITLELVEPPRSPAP